MHAACFYAIQPEEMNERQSIFSRGWVTSTYPELVEKNEKKLINAFIRKHPDASAEELESEKTKIHAKAIKTAFYAICFTIVGRQMGKHCDWCEICGRFFPYLLIKKDVAEYSMGRHYRSPCPDRVKGAPMGYRYVAAARKKDIDFDMIRQNYKKILTDDFNTWKAALETGDLTEAKKLVDSSLKIRENALVFGSSGETLYLAGESFDEYLNRRGLKISAYPFDFITGAADSKGMIGKICWACNAVDDGKIFADFRNCEVAKDWDRSLSDFIEKLPDEAVIVVVDCHV